MFLCLFESFWKQFESERRTVDLGTFKYYLVCRLVNTTRLLPLKFPLLLTQVPLPLTINSPRGRISGFNSSSTLPPRGLFPRGELIVNGNGNLRRNRRVMFMKPQNKVNCLRSDSNHFQNDSKRHRNTGK